MSLGLQHQRDKGLPPETCLVGVSSRITAGPCKLTNHATHPGTSSQPQCKRIRLGIIQTLKIPYCNQL